MTFSRTLYGTGTQSSPGVAFVATVADTPRPGAPWRLQRVSLTVPGYTTGALPAYLFIGSPGSTGTVLPNTGGVPQLGTFIGGTNQGQSDVWNGNELVNPGELISVLWRPPRITGIGNVNVTLSGSVECEVLVG